MSYSNKIYKACGGQNRMKKCVWFWGILGVALAVGTAVFAYIMRGNKSE